MKASCHDDVTPRCKGLAYVKYVTADTAEALHNRFANGLDDNVPGGNRQVYTQGSSQELLQQGSQLTIAAAPVTESGGSAGQKVRAVLGTLENPTKSRLSTMPSSGGAKTPTGVSVLPVFRAEMSKSEMTWGRHSDVMEQDGNKSYRS